MLVKSKCFMRKITRRSNCPISYALDFVGDKWVLLILRDMALQGKRFYKDFLDSEEGMATNVLADRLKMLESAGIIESKRYEKVKTMKVYSLTEKGKALIPALMELWIWGSVYDSETATTPEFLNQVQADKAAAINHIIAGLDEHNPPGK